MTPSPGGTYLQQVKQVLVRFQLLSLLLAQGLETTLLLVDHHHVRQLFLIFLGKFFAVRNHIL